MLELETITTTTKEQPRMANKLTATFKKVFALLEADAKYRDNDEALVVRIWNDEMKEQGMDANIMPTMLFMKFYRAWRFTTADIVTRSRRKCNELHPETRGLSYKPRKNKVPEVQQEIREITTATVQH